jgi:amidase
MDTGLIEELKEEYRMATPDDLALLDATAQAELVRKKEVQPIELVEAAIARIERLNPTLNAVITPMYELARTAAAEKLPGFFRITMYC